MDAHKSYKTSPRWLSGDSDQGAHYESTYNVNYSDCRQWVHVVGLVQVPFPVANYEKDILSWSKKKIWKWEQPLSLTLFDYSSFSKSVSNFYDFNNIKEYENKLKSILWSTIIRIECPTWNSNLEGTLPYWWICRRNFSRGWWSCQSDSGNLYSSQVGGKKGCRQ